MVTELGQTPADADVSDFFFVNWFERGFFMGSRYYTKQCFQRVSSLKINKACADDAIRKECIKASEPVFKQIYVRLFDIVFNTGHGPEV